MQRVLTVLLLAAMLFLAWQNHELRAEVADLRAASLVDLDAQTKKFGMYVDALERCTARLERDERSLRDLNEIK